LQAMRSIYKRNGYYFLVPNNKNASNEVNTVCERLGVVCYRFPRGEKTILYFSDNYNHVTNKTNLHDVVDTTLTSSEATISKIADKLCERFPQLSWGWID